MIAVIIEIIVNCFQGFIFTYSAYKILGAKEKQNYIQTKGWIFSAVIAAFITVFNMLTAYEAFLSLTYVAVILIYSIINLNGSLLKKSFASTIPLLTALFYPALVAIIYSTFLDRPVEEILSKWDIVHYSAVFMVQLLLYVTLKIIWSILGTDRQLLEKLDWSVIGSVTLLGMMNIIVLFLIAMEDVSDRIRYFLISDLLITFVINILICWLTVNVGRKKYENQQLKLQNLQNTYNKQYIDNANIEYEVIKKLRHDSMNIYSLLNDYISNGKYEEAQNYLAEIYNIANDKKIFVNTSNIALNSIINAKLSIAKSLSINTICMIEDTVHIMSDIDLCRMLSNMLDNAIQYLSSVDFGNKELQLKIYSQDERIIFLVRNTICSSVLKDNPQLLSRKKDDADHGFGIQVIKEIAEKYDGNAQFYEESGSFCCMVNI